MNALRWTSPCGKSDQHPRNQDYPVVRRFIGPTMYNKRDLLNEQT